MKFKLKVWTGPTLVKQIADKMREAGVKVLVEGTEHVHCEIGVSRQHVDGAAHNLLADLRLKHGTDFGLKPLPLTGAVERRNKHNKNECDKDYCEYSH